MERTVPTTESEEVELYLRTYYSLLRSSAEVQIRTLEEVHAGMKSLLHPAARDHTPDMAAFIYSLLRLPPCVSDAKVVVLGQSADVFARGGYPNVFSWQEVSAQARRRRCFYNGRDTLACFIASRSDIDDLIPLLTAYQIEWNKIYQQLQRMPDSFSFERDSETAQGSRILAEALEVTPEDMDRLYAIWGNEFGSQLERIAEAPMNFRVRLLNGSLSEYRRATQAWWRNIENSVPHLGERPVYFISSNTHSIVNLLTGFALKQQDRLIQYLEQSGNSGLLNEWHDIQKQRTQSNAENFLYYVYKKFAQTPDGRPVAQAQKALETELNIVRVPSKRYFDVEVQVFDLSGLDPGIFDPRLGREDLSYLADSDAMIVNIDYPLGLAAYNILSEVADNVGSLLGAYVMGKAATLNGVVGDVMIPDVVHDEHSQNTYLFPNCFCASDVYPYLMFGTVLDNQKAVTVQGTFLQTHRYMDVFYREGYTDIEMESGGFLSAVYELYRPIRHPMNEIVNLHGIPFDLGIIHYASDTPLSKGKNLGAGSLSYYGMDPTYAVSVAMLRRVFEVERQRLYSSVNRRGSRNP